MAKRGVKTIPLSVDDEDNIKLIEAEFGINGWATIHKLEQFIGAHGFYVKWDIDTQLLFIREKCLSAVGRNCVSEIVARALRRGVFDTGMYQKHGILTSTRLQETFLTAYKRSKEIVIYENYALPVVYEFIRNVDKSGKNVNILLKNANKTDTNKIKSNEIKDLNIVEFSENSTSEKNENSEETQSLKHCTNAEGTQAVTEEPLKVSRYKIEDVIARICKSYRTGRNNKTESRKHISDLLLGRKRFKGFSNKTQLNHFQILLAVKTYMRECEEKDLESDKVQLLSTFMNGRVLDYVEKTADTYEKAMLEHYGKDWHNIVFEYGD